MYTKRLLVCLLGGCISALVCLVGRQVIFGFPEIQWESIAPERHKPRQVNRNFGEVN